MVFVGIFYILGALIMPAYLKAKQLHITSTQFNLAGTIIPLTLLLVIMAAGFVISRRQEY